MVSSYNQCWWVRDQVLGQPRQVWVFKEQAAILTGVTNPEDGIGTYFKAQPGESFLECIGRLTSWLKPEATDGSFHEMKLGPAEFYPRMARPLALAAVPTLWAPNFNTEKAYVASARVQLTLLVRKLDLICQTVQPSDKTMDVYGHEIRNLLLLAATEAEMHWRGILKANGSSAAKPSSRNFVKLMQPLKLCEYSVSFPNFPELPPFKPFVGWLKEDPTNSLEWYAAYHGVKHNREQEFMRGTLKLAFTAVSACISLLVAQFGECALGAELASSVTVSPPSWSIPDMYFQKMPDADWTPVFHPGLD